MRLIDADALIDKTDDRYSLHEIGRRERDDIVDALEYAPTIQPEPAQWVQMLINPRMYRCSNCNIAWNKRLVFDLDNGNEMVMKYCPCCGKKMLAEVDYE